MSPAT